MTLEASLNRRDDMEPIVLGPGEVGIGHIITRKLLGLPWPIGCRCSDDLSVVCKAHAKLSRLAMFSYGAWTAATEERLGRAEEAQQKEREKQRGGGC